MRRWRRRAFDKAISATKAQQAYACLLSNLDGERWIV